MKENVQKEFHRKRRVLRILAITLTILIVLAATTVVWGVYGNLKQMQAYRKSIHIFSEEDIEIVSIKEENGKVFLDLRIRDDMAARYDILERHWYDKDDPTIACMQFFCYEKEYLLFDSTESYAEHRTQTGNQDSGLRQIYVETGAQQYRQHLVDGYTGFFSGLAMENNLLERDPDLPVSRIVYKSSEDNSDRHELILWENSGN